MERERQDGDPIPRASRRARGEISARFETHRCTKRRKNSGILSYFISPRIARLVGAIYSMDKQDGDFRNAFASIFNEIRFEEKNETKTKRWNVSLFNARIFHPKMNS